MSTPLDRLRSHVTGAIERGHAEPIAGQPASAAPQLPDVYATRTAFLATMSPLQASKANKALATRIRSGPGSRMRAELVERLHGFGWRVQGARFTDGRDFHDASTITKTGMAYAAFLAAPTHAPALTLAEKIKAARQAATERAMAEDDLHGCSRFPGIEADGADAARHGCPADRVPYSRAVQLDGAGRPCPEPSDYPAKRAAWLRGHRSVTEAPAHA